MLIFYFFFFFSSRRRHTRYIGDWSSDVCSSDLILPEASFSFLGFGDPNVISWGFMLQDAYNSQAMARHAFYWFVPPGLCIMLAVMAGFFIGRGYEELLFPRLRRR